MRPGGLKEFWGGEAVGAVIAMEAGGFVCGGRVGRVFLGVRGGWFWGEGGLGWVPDAG